MNLLSAPAPHAARAANDLDRAVRSLEAEWRDDVPPSLERLWAEHDPGRSLTVLAALIKADLR